MLTPQEEVCFDDDWIVALSLARGSELADIEVVEVPLVETENIASTPSPPVVDNEVPTPSSSHTPIVVEDVSFDEEASPSP